MVHAVVNMPVSRYLDIISVVLVLTVCVQCVPSDRQRQELLLLDSLGRRSAANQDYETFMDMLGRSKNLLESFGEYN